MIRRLVGNEGKQPRDFVQDDMIVSQNSGTRLQTPIFNNPHNWQPAEGNPDLGKS